MAIDPRILLQPTTPDITGLALGIGDLIAQQRAAKAEQERLAPFRELQLQQAQQQVDLGTIQGRQAAEREKAEFFINRLVPTMQSQGIEVAKREMARSGIDSADCPLPFPFPILYQKNSPESPASVSAISFMGIPYCNAFELTLPNASNKTLT